MTSARSRSLRITPVLLLGAVMGLAPVASAATQTASGEVFVVHGLAGLQADVLVDGVVVEPAAEAKTVVGPLELTPGGHDITLRPADGSVADLSASIEVAAGSSVDVVAHSTADPTAPPTMTVFPNDLTPVAAGKARLVVAHTAAVPPADIRVNGDVLFSNVANGEALTLLVPAGTYTVDIVPTGEDGPVVFGPVDLPVVAGQLNRVFAFGDPAENNMDAVVHTLAVPVEGAVEPMMVDTGTGGQAVSGLPTDLTMPLISLGALVAATAVVISRRRARA